MSDDEFDMETLDGIARTIAARWLKLDGRDRGFVTRKDPDLTDALYTLVGHLDLEDRRSEPVTAPREHPAEHRRADALHHAREAWVAPVTIISADEQARQITVIAQAFDRFLADGTVHEIPDAPQQADDATPEPPPEPTMKEARYAVMRAALDWVDRAHLRNPCGPDNWRDWVDDHDVTLINAVLMYRGLPLLERKKP